MRIRCGRCGHAEIIFTFRGDRFGQHHGAICAHCRKPITLKDCLFPRLMPTTTEEEVDLFHSLSENSEKLKTISGMAKPSGKR